MKLKVKYDCILCHTYNFRIFYFVIYKWNQSIIFIPSMYNIYRRNGQFDDLDLMNLEERLKAYVASFPEDEQTESTQQCQFKNAILHSGNISFNMFILV